MTFVDLAAWFTPVGPLRPRRPAELDAIEHRLGFTLPEDYRWLVTTFGPGLFDEWVTVRWADPDASGPFTAVGGLGVGFAGEPELAVAVAEHYAEHGLVLHEALTGWSPERSGSPAERLYPWGTFDGAEMDCFWVVRDGACVGSVVVPPNVPEQPRWWSLSMSELVLRILVEAPDDFDVPPEARPAPGRPHRFRPVHPGGS